MRLKIPKPRLEAFLSAESIQAGDRVVDAVFYSGATVPRFSWDRGEYNLTFSMEPDAVLLDRLNSGAPVLDSHRNSSVADVLGTVERAWLKDGKGAARLRFATGDEAVDRIWNRIEQKIARAVSMGVEVLELKETTEEQSRIRSFLATKWRPVEISVVGIGADPAASITMAAEGEYAEVEVIEKENNMPPIAEQIEKLVRQARGMCPGLSEQLAQNMVQENLTVEQARRRVFELMHRQSAEEPPTRPHHAAGLHQDQGESMVQLMAEAAACRYTGQAPSNGAREFMGMSMVRMAEACLRHAGRHVPNSGAAVIREALSGGMHSTSDFPNLLQGTGSRMLMAAYRAAQPQIKRIARRSTAVDFRTKSIIRLGEMPALLLVNEHGEVERGSRAESKESYRLRTYARIFALTRQAIINDDLSSFSDAASAFGASAATLEGKLLTDLLVSNPAMDDTVALFHADHNNLEVTNALDEAGLDTARLRLRRQTGLDGSTILDIPPAYLVVPAALETQGQKLLATIYAATSADVNPFSGTLQLVVDPRLDDDSATTWYLAADPGGPYAVLEYSHLEGAEGLAIETRSGFDVEGFEIKARLDFGTGAIGHRGMVKSTA